ncbi:molybdopterin-binding/glycosyltransferase family 2 protein [Candidatus Thiothrix sp. Deng01]|uniref:Molybdopterin-binding/glycosyltransferase family 2 protein n=1 Tax=Candidatus Thiothrix phosphatis TaxID=3112415 RepID=A0ABU6CXJ7_9GAMM|nr:molybdopterin-binding/glycosyltransferase family 2 protein [Candidatus Thiothrix sp. Deng01]MEB4591553.1 molybdopterin-binding/glycosyltransferase family 2 protein [Candidatus Thiothrix sp. Deng01]
MKFGNFSLMEAQGVRLAHTLRLAGRTLRKGRTLGFKDIEILRAQGIAEVTGAQLGTNELDEDQAASHAAQLLAGRHIEAQPAARGRCNLKATAAGVLLVDDAAIRALNRTDEALTAGTLAPFTPVRAGQVVATIKTIPFAVAGRTLASWKEITAAAAPLRIAPFRPHRTALVMTTADGLPDKLFATTAAVTRARLEALGSELAVERRCAHDSPAVAEAIRAALAQGAELILIAGASVSKDRSDTVPAGIVQAGGDIVHFGMPVEPGNMLLYARIGAVPVINLPGCSRSRRINGLDWLLHRLLADVPVSGEDIMDMGVGGLIASAAEGKTEIPEAPVPARPPRIAAVLLAAGSSSRMGERNKLCCEVDGAPMVRRVVAAALGSRCVQTLVVTGHEAEAVEDALQGCAVSFAHNAGFAAGMASSLRCGLRALPPDLDGAIILLGDMPQLDSSHINSLLDTFDPAAPAIVAPERDGKRGNPVLWPRHYFAEMQALQGDQGARSMVLKYADDMVLVAVEDDAIFTDIDTPEELARMTG